MEFPYPPSVVEDAIIARMDKLGFKKKESKGFLIYKDAVLTDISSEPADYLIKVERKSRKDKDESVVYFIINRNNENILARNDALVNSNAKTFMNRLAPDVDAYNLDMQIKDQEETVAKAEKKLKNLGEDQEIIEKKIKKLQEDLKDNAKDQENQQKEVEKQKQNLEDLKGKRKS
jgi:peptidoglycan hydrolase CwlO-like protein